MFGNSPGAKLKDKTEKILEKEKKTVWVMIDLYCQGRHNPGAGGCGECKELKEYTALKLSKCPFGAKKPACSKCKVHCYEPAKREKIKEVMRYAGPRMLTKHPLMAIRHLLKSK